MTPLRLALAALLTLPALAQAQTFTFANSNRIQLLHAPVPATPYPSEIDVSLPSCPAGSITGIRARTLGFWYSSVPQNIDVLLSGPGGQTLVLFGDRCGRAPIF
jgi:hypothetical protein